MLGNKQMMKLTPTLIEIVGGNISTTTYEKSALSGTLSYEVAWSADGTSLYTVYPTTSVITQHFLGTPFDIFTKYTSSTINIHATTTGEGTGVYCFGFSGDGSKLYVANGTSDRIFQFELTSPWDITTTTYQSQKTLLGVGQFRGLVVSRDGTRIFTLSMTDNKLRSYTLSTPWDITTLVFEYDFLNAILFSYMYDIEFSADGNHLYMLDANTIQKIFQYDLTTPWDISTLTTPIYEYSYSTHSTVMISICLNDDATKLLGASLQSPYSILQFNLTA